MRWTILTALYLGKQSLQLVRRWLVSRTATRIEANMMVRLVGHLLKTDLGALARERVGSLHGRISRSVEGFVKFLRVSFTDFFPQCSPQGWRFTTDSPRTGNRTHPWPAWCQSPFCELTCQIVISREIGTTQAMMSPISSSWRVRSKAPPLR